MQGSWPLTTVLLYRGEMSAAQRPQVLSQSVSAPGNGTRGIAPASIIASRASSGSTLRCAQYAHGVCPCLMLSYIGQMVRWHRLHWDRHLVSEVLNGSSGVQPAAIMAATA